MDTTTTPAIQNLTTSVHETLETLLFLIERAEAFAGLGSWIFYNPTGKLHFSRGLYHLLQLDSIAHTAEFYDIIKIVHPEDQELVEQHYSERMKNSDDHDITYRLLRPDGLIIHVHDRCERKLNSVGKIICTVGFLKNINDIKEKEDNLQRCRLGMDEFARSVSHDLHEPLRAINNFNRLLQMQYAEKLDDKGRDFIHRCLNAGRNLESRIDNLLMLSRLESRGKSFVSSDLNTLLLEAQTKLQQLINSRDAKITACRLPTLTVDADQIRTLFYHLLVNSLRYNKSNRPIVDIECRRKGSYHQISVRDNGIGIDKQFHQGIFMVFQRLHTQKEYEGEGIGLAVAKKIVERHGGTVWVEAEPAIGSTFHFTLPESNAGEVAEKI